MGSIEDTELFPGAGNTIGEVIVYPGCSFGALLGGNKDDAVGCTCTVNSAGGGVLQDLDGLDIGGVKVVYTAFDRHSVNNVEGV